VTAAEKPPGALEALRHHDFRLIAVGNMVSQMGTWVQYVAMGWIARELTDNTLVISFVFAAQWLPYLVLSPLTGVVADRLDRRKIVLWGNIAMITPAVALGLLIQAHRITIPLLVTLIIVAGSAQAFTQPAANAFIPALVPKEQLHSAVSLNAGLSNSTRVIGPLIGGLIISAWGVAWGFHVNAVSFLAVAIACVAVRTRPPKAAPSTTGVIDGLRSGVVYLRANRAAMRIIILTGSTTFLLMHAGLMSIVAKDVLHGDAGTYGLISAAPGFGFIVAAVLTTMLKTDRQRTITLLFSASGTGLALLIVGLSRSLPITVGAMSLFGGSIMTMSTLASTLLLATSADEYRGRVMGLYGMVSTGLFTVNSIIGGAIAATIGTAFTIWLCGVAVIVAVALFAATGTLDVIRSALLTRSGPAHDADHDDGLGSFTGTAGGVGQVGQLLHE
jgi:MFS family permease